MNPKISIIANFYNSAKYIPRLLRSILSQTFDDWELIAVNDCSPSNDLEVLRKWEAKSEMKGRLKIVNNTVNQGISKAKNTGILAASGDFLTFIDGDDWFESDALQSMYDAANKDNADIIIANSYRTYKFGYRQKNVSLAKYGIVYSKDAIRTELIHGFCGKNILSDYGYWGKLYRRSLVLKSGYQPRKVTASEDLFFNLYNFLAADRIIFIPDFVYNWRWGGISSGSKNRSEISFSSMGSIRNFNDFYFEKMEIPEIRNNQKCVRSLQIEIYNVLCTSFGSLCKFEPTSKYSEEIKALISDAISMPAYREILTIKGDPYVHDQYFFDALETGDVDWLYDFFRSIYKANWKRRMIRSIASLIIK